MAEPNTKKGVIAKTFSWIKANPWKSLIIGWVLIVAITKSPQERATEKIAEHEGSSQITQAPMSLEQMQRGADSLMKLHDNICNTALSTLVQSCMVKNRDRSDAAEWCVNVLREAKQHEGC